MMSHIARGLSLVLTGCVIFLPLVGRAQQGLLPPDRDAAFGIVEQGGGVIQTDADSSFAVPYSTFRGSPLTSGGLFVPLSLGGGDQIATG
ncbi:MAG TPA: hypothetical protein VFC44_08435, partial [Candidatus Saccharimonadales bacterium]|nr:hypothetical protein [Candidatus Saccharimonadales bacterium]